ncbi:leukocyte surface antigen CD53 [Copidosoma floridanum]|uniref:leukocyte surface antigen CD53 n=1 Tax=Copidosoma floridanum TaxID=29053 RepID=UPI0006C98F6D|nr:leukocyte surface antigen CD53 [Copidosoma floridanum]
MSSTASCLILEISDAWVFYCSEVVGIAWSYIFIIIIGSAIFLTAIFSCFSAFKENSSFVTASISLQLTSLTLGIVAIVIFIINREKYANFYTNLLYQQIESYDKIHEYREEIDLIQQEFQCCGYDGPHDWLKKYSNVPESCCKKFDLWYPYERHCSLTSAYSDGCQITYAYIGYVFLCCILAYAAVMAVIQIAATVISFALRIKIKKRQIEQATQMSQECRMNSPNSVPIVHM